MLEQEAEAAVQRASAAMLHHVAAAARDAVAAGFERLTPVLVRSISEALAPPGAGLVEDFGRPVEGSCRVVSAEFLPLASYGSSGHAGYARGSMAAGRSSGAWASKAGGPPCAPIRTPTSSSPLDSFTNVCAPTMLPNISFSGGSEASVDVGKMKSMRDLHDDLASSILKRSGMRSVNRRGSKLRQRLGLADTTRVQTGGSDGGDLPEEPCPSPAPTPTAGSQRRASSPTRGGLRSPFAQQQNRPPPSPKQQKDEGTDGDTALRKRLFRRSKSMSSVFVLRPTAEASVCFENDGVAQISTEVGHSGTDTTSHKSSGPDGRAASHRTARRSAGRMMTNSQVLENRVNELTDIIPNELDVCEFDADECSSVPRWCSVIERALFLSFRLVGILSWDGPDRPQRFGLFYRGLLTALLSVAFISVTAQVVATRLGDPEMWPFLSPFGVRCPNQERLATEVLLAAASAMLLVSLGFLRGQRRLDGLMSTLQTYAHHHDLSEMWHKCAVQDIVPMLALFLCAVLIHGVDSYCPAQSTGNALVYVFVSAVVAGVLWVGFSFLLYVLRILTATVDVFCYQSVQNPDVSEATESWNMLQALLRRASTSIELGLLVLLAIAGFTVPAFVLDKAILGSYSATFRFQLPYVLVVCGVLRVFAAAAAVTDKCMRVPALINSLSFGPGTERERHHLVEYISHSAAGFYICDVRLTLGMVAKFLYVWSVICFGFVGRELTDE